MIAVMMHTRWHKINLSELVGIHLHVKYCVPEPVAGSVIGETEDWVAVAVKFEALVEGNKRANGLIIDVFVLDMLGPAVVAFRKAEECTRLDILDWTDVAFWRLEACAGLVILDPIAVSLCKPEECAELVILGPPDVLLCKLEETAVELRNGPPPVDKLVLDESR